MPMNAYRKLTSHAHYSEHLILAKFVRFHITNRIQKLRSNACIEGPGRYREVGDALRNNSVPIAPLDSFVVPSYDQKTKSSSINI